MQFDSLCSGIERAAEIQPFCCDLLAKDGIYTYSTQLTPGASSAIESERLAVPWSRLAYRWRQVPAQLSSAVARPWPGA